MRCEFISFDQCFYISNIFGRQITVEVGDGSFLSFFKSNLHISQSESEICCYSFIEISYHHDQSVIWQISIRLEGLVNFETQWLSYDFIIISASHGAYSLEALWVLAHSKNILVHEDVEA